MKIVERSLTEHQRALTAGEYSSIELTRACFDRIAETDGEIGAFLTLNFENAMRDAAASDRRRAEGRLLGRLDGIPYALKDNFCTRGLRTTCASHMLEHFVPPYDASVVKRLSEAGCVLLGKLNMDEFAMGSTGDLSAIKPTCNPHNTEHASGGSSSGSAASVAALQVPFALGSDTGGSVRQPAAFCGVMGLKPTYGSISRHGMIAMASSLDCVGIVTRTAADTAEVLAVLQGRDAQDMTTHACPDFCMPDFENLDLKGLRVAVVRELSEGGAIAPEVIGAFRVACATLKRFGAVIEEVSLPSPDIALATYCVLSGAEASSNLARFDGVRFGNRTLDGEDLFSLYANSRGEGFGAEVKRRILFGTHLLSEENRARYYHPARTARAEIRDHLFEILSRCDLILTPTAPTTAFRRGAKLTPAQKRRADLCAVYANLGGLPALSVPCGRSADGLPLAVQLTAAPFAEGQILRTAHLLEQTICAQAAEREVEHADL